MDEHYLAGVLSQVGPENCDRSMFADILQQTAPIIARGGNIEAQVARALVEMANSGRDWDTLAFGASVKDVDIYGAIDADAFFGEWKFPKAQLDLILQMLGLPQDLWNFSLLKCHKVITVEDCNSLSHSVRPVALSLYAQTWNCMNLFVCTSSYIDSEKFESAKPIFELASRQSPELLCLSLARLDPHWNSINKEILVKLSCGFLVGQPTSSVVLPLLWKMNANVMLFCMVEMHRRDQSCLSRLLDICQELKILPIIIDTKPFGFAIDLACLASRRQYLNLEKWCADCIREKGEAFVSAAVEYVFEKLKLRSSPISSMDQLVALTRCLRDAPIPSEFAAHYQSIVDALKGEVLSSSDRVVEAGEVLFPGEVEEEVNDFFDRIFAREISVPDVIEVLRKLKSSSDSREQQVFACFLHNIFDEYRFFAKYPDSELNLTAVLFGQMINCQLISNVPLTLALKCVLDSLKKPAHQKLYRFGVQALLQFSPRLPEWPQYCSLLLQVQQLQQTNPDLYAFASACLMGNQTNFSAPVTRPDMPTDVLGQSDSKNALVEASEKAKLSAPPESVRDRILFILNNLSLSNLEAKANDLVRVLDEGYFAWLAQYIVVKRVSMENNYHSLYLSFLDTLQVHSLEQHVVDQTYDNIYILLKSQKITTSSSERQLLKNLGSWLGGLTVARDRPILHRHLCLKTLILDAYASEKLIAIVPFVAKILEQCVHSRAFVPENPWLMAILRLLSELYSFADLKLNLKFEIEVLCKHLSVDLSLLEPSNLLKNRFSNRGNGSSLSEILPGHPSSSFKTLLSPFVSVNGRLVPGRQAIVLKLILSAAIELAIRDVGVNIAERSCAISESSSKKLAMKDFQDATYNDEIRAKAVQSLSAFLATQLSSATSRDLIKSSIINGVRMFSQWCGHLPAITDNVIEATVDDNLDLACALVEKQCLKMLPRFAEGDRPGMHSLMSKSLVGRIYEEAGRKIRLSYLHSLPEVSLEPMNQSEVEKLGGLLSACATSLLNEVTEAEKDLSPGVPATDNSLDAYFEAVCLKFVDLVAAIEQSISSCTEASVSELGPSHAIRGLMKQIILLASSSPIHRDELCLLMSQRLMQGLYRTDSQLYIDVIILLLIKIFEFSSKAAKEVTTWVVHSTDERKFSVPATAALFGSGLIYVLDFDGQLSKLIDAGKESAISFAVSLIRKCVFDTPPVAAPYDFVYSLESLGQVMQKNGSDHPEVAELLQAIAALVKAPQPESQQLRDQVTFCFTDWFRLCQYPSISEKLIASFVSQLYQKNFLADETSARNFFQISIELSVELYVRQRRSPAILSYRSIDTFARLIGQILRHRPKDYSGVDPLTIVTIVHSVAGIILVEGLEKGIDYLQRPFSRLFCSLASEVSGSGVINISEILENLSPSNCPTFLFGWLDVIFNKDFMPALLSDKKMWPVANELLVEYLDFAYPLFIDVDRNNAVKFLYRGTLKSFLVILYDCPEFFVEYGPSLVVHIPPLAVQLKNSILSAQPENMDVPDPLSFPLSSADFPPGHMPSVSVPGDMKAYFDSYLAGQIAVSALIDYCKASPKTGFYGWNYAAVSAVSFQLAQNSLAKSSKDFSPLSDFTGMLLKETPESAKYVFLSSLVDHLTYPNSWSHYIIRFILYAFHNIADENGKEILVRTLLERLIVHRPHPWAIMVTFIELVKNPTYSFWDLRFTKINPEIEKVFDAISRSCLAKGN